MLERGLCCFLLCCIMQHCLGSHRQTRSEVWDCVRGPLPEGCEEGPLCSLAAREGGRALGVEHFPAAQAGPADGQQEGGRSTQHSLAAGQCGRGCWMHLLLHGSVSGLHKEVQNH